MPPSYAVVETVQTASAVRRRSSLLREIQLSVDQVFGEATQRRSSVLGKRNEHGGSSYENRLPRLESASGLEGESDDSETDESDGHSWSLPTNKNEPIQEISSVTWRDYWHVLTSYPKYRCYLLSHICQHMGDWFVRIASLLFVEELGGGSGKSLAMLVLSDHLPRVVFAQVGGLLSDRYDRRHLMIAMDLMSGVAVLGFLLAVQYHSLPLLYATSTVRASIGAAYYPVTSGIVPLLVPDVRDLQFAITLNGWAWSCMAILGGTVAGSATAVLGLKTCYIIDCVTYFISAAVMLWGVSGRYNVSESSTSTLGMGSSVPKSEIFKQLVSYLSTCGFGLLVLMKASAGLVWGPEDIIGVQFATVRDEDGNEEEKPSSFHMGLLFSVIGLGCLLGPVFTNVVSDARRPSTLQRACVVGFVFLTVGWLLISRAHSFDSFLAGTLVRTMGSGIVWMNSAALLQALAEKEILGRMLALEYVCLTLTESLSATITGELSDEGLSKQELALFGASLGFAMICSWSTYHYLSMGAARGKFNEGNQDDMVKQKGARVEIELPTKGDEEGFEDEFV